MYVCVCVYIYEDLNRYKILFIKVQKSSSKSFQWKVHHKYAPLNMMTLQFKVQIRMAIMPWW